MQTLYTMRAGLALGLWLISAAGAGAAIAPETGALKPDVIYKSYCSVCHGERGDGRSRASNSLVPPPRDFTTAATLTREKMIDAAANGKPGTAMMPWNTRLSGEQIEAVVDYIRTSFMQTVLDPRLARGQVLYGHHCQTCHGDRGRGVLPAGGGAPPRDFSAPQAKAQLTRARMIAAVTHGQPGTAMEGYATKMTRQQIELVVDYLRQVLMAGPATPSAPGADAYGARQPDAAAVPPGGGATAPAQADMGLPMPDGLAGDPTRGEKSFLENCVACHGAQGDGKGPRSHFITPKPRDFLSQQARVTLNRPALFSAIHKGRPGTTMPTWSTVLSGQEIANVAEFVFQAYIRPGGVTTGSK